MKPRPGAYRLPQAQGEGSGDELHSSKVFPPPCSGPVQDHQAFVGAPLCTSLISCESRVAMVTSRMLGHSINPRWASLNMLGHHKMMS